MTPDRGLHSPEPALWRRSLARIYGGAVDFRLGLYNRGIVPSKSLPARVISVGNLTVGGTGKTPAAVFIARQLQARGRRVAVLSRGYRGRSRKPVNVVADGRDILLGPEQAGDEPYLMAKALPGVPILTGRDRWVVGQYALDCFQPEIFVLDDGFQHLRLVRDLNLLLLDTAQPWGNGRLVPAGPLREPRDQAARADAFVITRVVDRPTALLDELDRDFPGRPVFLARHQPARVHRLDDGQPEDLKNLAGRRMLAFCGLARPDNFLDTLTGLKIEVPLFLEWPDHYRPRNRDLRKIEKAAQIAEVREAVTTAKDAVKLRGRPLGRQAGRDLEVWVLDVDLEIVEGLDRFLDLLEADRREG